MKKLSYHKAPQPRKNQKCFACKKLIKKVWAFNGKWYHGKCFDKIINKRIRDYLKDLKRIKKGRTIK